MEIKNKNIKTTWKIFKKRTNLDILIKSYIIIGIIFSIFSIILNSFYPIILSLSFFSFFVIIAGGLAFIETYDKLVNKK